MNKTAEELFEELSEGDVVKYKNEEMVIMAIESSLDDKTITVFLEYEDGRKSETSYYSKIALITDVEPIHRAHRFPLPKILKPGTKVKINCKDKLANGRVGTIWSNDMVDCLPDLRDLNYYVKFSEAPYINKEDSNYDYMCHKDEVEVI